MLMSYLSADKSSKMFEFAKIELFFFSNSNVCQKLIFFLQGRNVG